MDSVPRELYDALSRANATLAKENRELWKIAGRRGRSHIVRPEWAEGEQWADWHWHKSQQKMVAYCSMGTLEIDDEGDLHFDNWDDYAQSLDGLPVCNHQLAKKIADLILSEYPCEPDPESEAG